MSKTFSIFLKTVLLAALLGAVVSARPAFAFRRLAEGDKLPDFTVHTLAGEQKKLSESLGEKATLVLFWAAWSPRSIEALADFQTLYEKRKESGLAVIAVNVEHQEPEPGDAELISSTLRGVSASYPSFVDRSLEIYNAVGVNSTPSIAILDREMTVKILLSGYPTIMRDEFMEKVEALLSGEKAKTPEAAAALPQPAGKAIRYYQSAKIFVKKGMNGHAAEALKKALELDAEYVDALRLLAELNEKAGDAAGAETYRARLEKLGK